MVLLSSFLPSSLPPLSLSLPLSPSHSSPHRSHALSSPLLFFLILLASLPSSSSSPYYEREWNGAASDDLPQFEADSSSSGAPARPSDPSSLSIPDSGPSSRAETTPDRAIRPETIMTWPVLPTSLPTVISLDMPTVPSSLAAEQDNRMIEIMANLTKKLESKQAGGTGSDISISFTPDELKRMQEIIGATDLKLRSSYEITRRQLMIPNGPLSAKSRNSDSNRKGIQISTRYFEAPVTSAAETPTSTDVESLADRIEIEEERVMEEEDLEVTLDEPLHRPAECHLSTEDEMVTLVWSLMQNRIREWGFDEEESMIVVLATLGLFVDSEPSPAISESSVVQPEAPKQMSFFEQLHAAILCTFRTCTRALHPSPTPPRVWTMPNPKMKRDIREAPAGLVSCSCPSGYYFD